MTEKSKPNLNPIGDTAKQHQKSQMIKQKQWMKIYQKVFFIKSFENITTDPSNPRILKFDFTLVVNPDKPI